MKVAANLVSVELYHQTSNEATGQSFVFLCRFLVLLVLEAIDHCMEVFRYCLAMANLLQNFHQAFRLDGLVYSLDCQGSIFFETCQSV
jgi:ferritin